MTQYCALSPERWASFGIGQQILQIGLEMQRALKHLQGGRSLELRACYERALGLTDLTVATRRDPGLRRELLRWREVVAGLYLRPEPDLATHRQAMRVLLRLHPESAAQVAVLGL